MVWTDSVLSADAEQGTNLILRPAQHDVPMQEDLRVDGIASPSAVVIEEIRIPAIEPVQGDLDIAIRRYAVVVHPEQKDPSPRLVLVLEGDLHSLGMMGGIVRAHQDIEKVHLFCQAAGNGFSAGRYLRFDVDI